MGFLDKLKAGGDATIGVSLEPGDVTPGAEVVLRVDVGGDIDDKCRAVRAGITCTGHYLVKERDRDADGDVDVDEVWRTVDIHEEAHEFPVAVGPLQAHFTVPPGAQPSSEDAVEWTAWARIDREKGRDVVERLPLPVRFGPDTMPAERPGDPSNEGLTLLDVPAAVRAGEPLTGTLGVSLADDAKVTAVRIRLHRRRTYVADTIEGVGVSGGQSLVADLFLGGGASRIVKDDEVTEVDLAGKRSFEPGQSERLEFSVAVPAEAGPSTTHQHGQVDWRVEAVLDRRMRGDLSVEAPVVVF